MKLRHDMKQPLRLLNVEDSEDDARLLLRQLERGDYEITAKRVDTAETLTNALDRESWDILFCDFTMPQFSGQTALKIVKERDLNLPFIFVSGTIGEDVAVQAMKEGAHDYVMKNNLARLLPAMEHALQEADVRRQRAEAELNMRVSERKYRHLFESLGDAAFLIDRETGRIIDSNPQAEALLGRSRTEILGMNESKLYRARKEDLQPLTLLPAKDRKHRFESNALQKNGGIVPVHVSVSEIELYGRRLWLELFHDLRTHKSSEKKIQEQAQLLELAHDAIFVRSLDEKVQYWNKGAELLYGWTAEGVMGGNFGKMTYEDRTSFVAAKKILLEQGSWSGEVRKLTKALREVVVASRWTLVRDGEGNPSSILVIDTDVTEKKQLLEAHFLRAQRLELIGTLAGGIAHDLNNILQIIVTNLDLAMSAPPSDERVTKYLYDAGQGAARAANLGRRLLTFSKGGAPIKQSLDVADLVTPAVLLALSGSKLKPLFSFQRDLDPVIGDPVQLTQVIENLVINACEATPQSGSLLVRAENVDQGTGSSGLPGRRSVRIQFEDWGTGIPGSILNKIYETCFTTKSGGSGLGLATVKSIMQQHGGGVAIASLVGRGTIVTLMLPVAAQRPEPPVASLPLQW
jgi:PAS domain S-box-containing protein